MLAPVHTDAPFELRDAEPADLPGIARLLNREIATATSTWATAPRSADEMAAWFEARRRPPYAVLVAQDALGLLGYAALGRFRDQEGFALTAEHSVYVDPAARGRGVGDALLGAIAARARAEGLHALVGCVGTDNEGSVRLHRRHGFEPCGVLPEVGRKFGRWLDLALFVKRL